MAGMRPVCSSALQADEEPWTAACPLLGRGGSIWHRREVDLGYKHLHLQAQFD